jgi:competence protein ComEC
VFRDTGVAHLMSISGLHITMLGWLGGAAIGALWRRSERATLAWPAPAAARWGGVGVAWLYALLAGWGVPAQRTVVMLAATAVLRGAGLSWPPALVTLAAMLPVTLLDPWALLQPGFWLSFAAVGLLMMSAPARAVGGVVERSGGGDGRGGGKGVVRGGGGDGRGDAVDSADVPANEPPGGWFARLASALRAGIGRLGAELRGGVRAQVVATVGLAPLTLVAFQQVSPVGLLANLVAEPWVTLVVTPLTLLGIVLPPLWTLAALALKPLLWWLAWLARWPYASVHVATAPAWSLAAGLVGGAVLMLPLPRRLRGLGLALLPPLLWPFVARPAPGRFELVAADVGQGTAVLVRTHAHLLMFDTGPPLGDDNDTGRRLLLPLLQARGEPRIDTLLLSHADADHVGGAQSLIDRLPVEALRTSLSPGHPLRANPIPHTACLAGQRWTWDGVRFAILHPFPADYRPGAKTNALSCVLRVVGADGRSALLTGDVEAPGEGRLVARARLAPEADRDRRCLGGDGGDGGGGGSRRDGGSANDDRCDDARLRSDVLVVPHHGSHTSSTDAFLDAVHPAVAVIQVGYRSRYGHPAPDVVARYRAHGIPVVRTDHCGAWTWAEGQAACTRDRRRHYWQWQGADEPLTPTWIGRPAPPGEP